MFDVLGTLRRIRDDEGLPTSHKLVLMCAVLRTNNSTGVVRCSQEILAADAGVTSRTVRAFYGSESFSRYFEATKEGRKVMLTWIPEPDSPIKTPEPIPENISSEEATPEMVSRTPEAVSDHLLLSTSTTSSREKNPEKLEEAITAMTAGVPVLEDFQDKEEFLEADDAHVDATLSQLRERNIRMMAELGLEPREPLEQGATT